MQTPGEGITHSIGTGSIVRAVLVLVGFYFLYFIRDVVLIILSAIVIASAIEPGTVWFTKRRVPRVLATLMIYVGIGALLVTTFYFFLIPLVQESSVLLQTLPGYSRALASASSTPSNVLQGITAGFSLPVIIDTVNGALINLSSGFFGTIDVIFGGLLSFFLIIIISFYLGVQEDGVGDFLRMVLPVKQEEYIIGLWKRSKVKIGLWMQGQLLLGIIVAVLTFLGLTLLGVRNALLLSVLAGVFEIIPLFGAFLSAIPAILVAFLDGGVSLAIIVALLFLIIQQFESQLIYPLVVKKVVGVPPIISILALVIGAKVAGFLGVILSVPIAAVCMELLADIEHKKTRAAAKE